jgi:Zn-dependent protease with chaperone function
MAGAVGCLPRFAMLGGGRDGQGRPAANPLVVLLAPVAAMLLQFAISRQREFGADRVGAELSGKPLALASTLRRLDAAPGDARARRRIQRVPIVRRRGAAAPGGRRFQKKLKPSFIVIPGSKVASWPPRASCSRQRSQSTVAGHSWQM